MVFEAGCGTGFATVLLAQMVIGQGGRVTAVDISEGMLRVARRRVEAGSFHNAEFVCGDALEILGPMRDVDLVFCSWVLGYIPVEPFLKAARRALKPGGHVAFIVDKQNSPRRELELFGQLVARDPSALLKQVFFDFPRDAAHVRSVLLAAGLQPTEVWEEPVCSGT